MELHRESLHECAVYNSQVYYNNLTCAVITYVKYYRGKVTFKYVADLSFAIVALTKHS